MSNRKKLPGPGQGPLDRLSAAAGDLAADRNAHAGRFTRILELVTKYNTGKGTVQQLADRMPPGRDKRELLALLTAVLPADPGPGELDGQHND
jgi:hypothetical protein